MFIVEFVLAYGVCPRLVKSPSPQSRSDIKQLDALKEQGLITDAEYTDKRAAILAVL